MGNLIPDEALIYERVDGILYARYRDPPHNKIKRWVVGGDANSIERSKFRLTHKEWKELVELSNDNIIIKKQLDKLLELYYLVKDTEVNKCQTKN